MEYQYYEFQALDRRLTQEEQTELRRLSSRANVTPNHAIYTYSYGDFRGDPENILAQYFDALLHVTNWGNCQLAFRFPTALLDRSTILPYCTFESVSITRRGEYWLLNINIMDETGGSGNWIEGEGKLSALVPLRQSILQGDLRCLYLAWLKAATVEGDEEIDGEMFEPPVPPNLHQLTPELETFIELFEIDEDLLSVVVEASPALEGTDEDFVAAIETLSEEERKQWLLRLAQGEPNLRFHLLKRLRERTSAAEPQRSPTRRRLDHLLRLATQRRKARKLAERQAEEQARLKRLEQIAATEESMWANVMTLIEEKQIKSYDEAIKLLKDLSELAAHQGKLTEFNARVRAIAAQYRTRPGLISRLQSARLLPL
ncbi:MAG TPA: hypothetical protein VGD58_20450 [Herpetosiphonaceae bacterium]